MKINIKKLTILGLNGIIPVMKNISNYYVIDVTIPHTFITLPNLLLSEDHSPGMTGHGI